MLLSALDAKNPVYTAYSGAWAECAALYNGGDHFKALLDTFLPQNPQEPVDVYASRKRESAYVSYMGAIIDYYVAWLYSAQFSLVARTKGSTESVEFDNVYDEFEADVGGDVSLNDFLRNRTTEALHSQCSHWLIELPPVDAAELATLNRVEYKERKLDRPTLRAVSRDEVYDWECDSLGKLNWVIIHSKDEPRNDPRKEGRDWIVETWAIYDKTNVQHYELRYKKNESRPPRETDVKALGPAVPHRFKELPLVNLAVVDGLWIGDRVRAPQIEHFRCNSAKNWLIRRTCYAMPAVFMEDPSADPGIMGAGYYLKFGHNDKFEWTAPPNAPFDVLQKSCDANRDEIYRIVHQMAQGLDNNAETTGRSADSKQIDTSSTRILLNAYGKLIRKAIEETLEILSDAIGNENLTWSVDGFAGYDTATVGELVANSSALRLLNIPSKTLRCESDTKVAMAFTAESSPSTRNQIKQEIKSGIDNMEEIDAVVLPPDLAAELEKQRLKNEASLKIADKKSEDVKIQANATKVANKARKAKPG